MSAHDRNDMDPELIARVLEGRATKAERDRVLAAADQEPELLALLADSAAALGEEAVVLPMQSRRFPRGVWMGIAAALLVAVTIPMWMRDGGEIPALSLQGGPLAGALPAARAGAAISTVRGASPDDRVRLSVILGARVADYIALGSDTARGTAAAEIASALRAIPGGSVAAATFDASGEITMASITSVEQVVDVPVFRAAGWAESARLAALSRQEWAARDLAASAFEAIAAAKEFGEETRVTARQLAEAVRAGDHARTAELASSVLGAMVARRR